MFKHRCLAAILSILLVASPVALASAAPFTQADVEDISEGLASVGDYVDALAPTSYSWVYQGAATGATYLTMRTDSDGTELGEATIALYVEGELIDGQETGERETLPEGLSDFIAAERRSEGPYLAKLTSRRTRPRARSKAARAMPRFSFRSSGVMRSERSISSAEKSAIRRLLKSWAIPAAKRLSASKR